MRDFTQSYGVRRVAEIAAKVAKCRAALIEAPVEASQNLAAVETTAPATALPFVQRFPHLAAAHLKAQRRMWAAAKSADLSPEIAPRLAGINALLGTCFTSSRELSPDELHAVADAIGAGRYSGAWQLDANLTADEAPLPEAPDESELAPEVGTPAPLERLDEIAMEFDLAQMRDANRARLLNSLRCERVLLETRLRELDHAILTA